MTNPEVTLSTEKVFQGKRISVRVDRVRLTDGTESIRDIVEHPDAVVIAAVDDQRNLIFVRQYRKAPETELLELPAGVIDPGEEPIVAAMRELREETGYSAERLEEIGSFYSAPGTMTEMLYAYLASGLNVDPLPADEDERIAWPRALEMARSGEIIDAKSLATLLLAESRVSEHFNLC